MTFASILFTTREERRKCEQSSAPDYFFDLNLDQIVDTITSGRDEYNLKPFFYMPLRDIDSIKYRQEVAQDLEKHDLFNQVIAFSEKIKNVQNQIKMIDNLYNKHHQEGWLLEAISIYCDAVKSFSKYLADEPLTSRGFNSFCEHIRQYTDSNQFRSLQTETGELKNQLRKLRYCIHIIFGKGKFNVFKYEQEKDYSIDIEETFEKFNDNIIEDNKDFESQNQKKKRYLRPKTQSRYDNSRSADGSTMNHIESIILNFAAKLHPDIFSRLHNYALKNRDFMDKTIADFTREIQFYIAVLEHAATIKQSELMFCYPQVTTGKDIFAYATFDLALADKKVKANSTVVCNDFSLREGERILLVTGPNQGGKTTFARTFGQIHYLAALGCPVPGSKAQLFSFSALMTHFEKEENIKNLRGKLQDDLIRMHDILRQAAPGAIVIVNEIFTSTTYKDALYLSKKVIESILQKDMFCVWVTFIDELAELSEKIVSMVSTVDPENPALRTYKIVRKPPDGLAHALAIAAKHNLTYNQLGERITL